MAEAWANTAEVVVEDNSGNEGDESVDKLQSEMQSLKQLVLFTAREKQRLQQSSPSLNTLPRVCTLKRSDWRHVVTLEMKTSAILMEGCTDPHLRILTLASP